MHSNTVLCFFILFLLSGCSIREECTQPETRDKLTLRWSYEKETDTNFLKKEIRQINVYLFSENNHFIKSWFIPPNKLFVPEASSLELSPGKYTIIAWANLRQQTNVTPETPNQNTLLTDFRLLLANPSGQTGYPTSDSLLHSQVDIEFSGEDNQYYTLPFRRECCYFKIYMEGFSHVPQIKIRGMPGGYNLEGHPLPIEATHIPNISYHEASGIYETSLATLRPATASQLYLELYRKEADTPTYTLNLNEVLKELGIDPQKDDEVNILIRLKALEGERLSIGVNNWHIIENININM